jgi:predicted  nucleic acid-binding Zn-ribbon protein
MDAYQKGIVDRQEVLKKTEIFDMEGVMERTDMIAQLQQQLQGAQEQIKQLKGDLQTRDREAVNLRKKIEVEKFKTDMDQVSNKSKAASTLFEKRLGDEMSLLKRDIAVATKPDSTPSGQKGQS